MSTAISLSEEIGSSLFVFGVGDSCRKGGGDDWESLSAKSTFQPGKCRPRAASSPMAFWDSGRGGETSRGGRPLIIGTNGLKGRGGMSGTERKLRTLCASMLLPAYWLVPPQMPVVQNSRPHSHPGKMAFVGALLIIIQYVTVMGEVRITPPPLPSPMLAASKEGDAPLHSLRSTETETAGVMRPQSWIRSGSSRTRGDGSNKVARLAQNEMKYVGYGPTNWRCGSGAKKKTEGTVRSAAHRKRTIADG